MKVRIPIVIKDPVTARYYDMDPTETYTIKKEAIFLDGPVNTRVAILDFDDQTGRLLPGSRFKAPEKNKIIGGYNIPDKSDLHSPEFIQVSVFGTIMKTIEMFEEDDALGRRLTWAFNAPQLLVIPRAGMWANAFYERETHSLQFFYFQSVNDLHQRTIYTSLSHDIVSHETGHAILDAIAPDLYNCISPQSLALHEAIADLTAVVMAFRCEKLKLAVLKQTNGSIYDSSAFSGIAEEFATAGDPNGRKIFLRNLLNNKILAPYDDHQGDSGEPNSVSRSDPHSLSEVLSGALYSVMIKIYESVLKAEVKRTGRSEYSASGKALYIATERFKRMIFRALDYLPPGEVSFADYARAIIASDQSSYPHFWKGRHWIREEFINRHMVSSLDALQVKTNFELPTLKKIKLETLVESDWAAYEFANQHRKVLGIPQGIHFKVMPRLDTTKKYFIKKEEQNVRECLFKVSWDYNELNNLGSFYPPERQITIGTTLAIDWNTRNIRAIISSDFSQRAQANKRVQSKERRRQKDDRDLLLRRLVDEGVLLTDGEAHGPDGNLLRTAIKAETMGNLMRVRGAARMLHIITERIHE